MKRLAAMTLALCLMAGSALAQPLRVVDMGFGGGDEYQAAFPDRQVETLRPETDDLSRSNAQRFLLENPQGWDVAYLWSDQCDLNALEEAGLLMDLSGVEALAGRAENAYEPIRQVVTREGKVLAAPSGIFGLVMQLGMYPTVRMPEGEVDVLGPLGLSVQDAPGTFAELSAFALRYMEIPKEARKGRVFHIDAAVSNPKTYFLEYLIELYTAQYTDATGAVNYDTPAFRQALEELDAMGAALQAEPKITYGQGGGVYGVLNDVSSSLLPNAKGTVPLYLGVGDNRSLPAKLGMVVVNANTQQREEAVVFAQWSTQNGDTHWAPQILKNLDYEALARRSYDENIEAQKNQNEAQWVIDSLIQERDKGDYPGYYPRENIQFYGENIAPRLTFPRYIWVDRYAAAQQYARGKLDQEGLIAELNRMAAETWAD